MKSMLNCWRLKPCVNITGQVNICQSDWRGGTCADEQPLYLYLFFWYLYFFICICIFLFVFVFVFVLFFLFVFVFVFYFYLYLYLHLFVFFVSVYIFASLIGGEDLHRWGTCGLGKYREEVFEKYQFRWNIKSVFVALVDLDYLALFLGFFYHQRVETLIFCKSINACIYCTVLC